MWWAVLKSWGGPPQINEHMGNPDAVYSKSGSLAMERKCASSKTGKNEEKQNYKLNIYKSPT